MLQRYLASNPPLPHTSLTPFTFIPHPSLFLCAPPTPRSCRRPTLVWRRSLQKWSWPRCRGRSRLAPQTTPSPVWCGHCTSPTPSSQTVSPDILVELLIVDWICKVIFLLLNAFIEAIIDQIVEALNHSHDICPVGEDPDVEQYWLNNNLFWAIFTGVAAIKSFHSLQQATYAIKRSTKAIFFFDIKDQLIFICMALKHIRKTPQSVPRAGKTRQWLGKPPEWEEEPENRFRHFSCSHQADIKDEFWNLSSKWKIGALSVVLKKYACSRKEKINQFFIRRQQPSSIIVICGFCTFQIFLINGNKSISWFIFNWRNYFHISFKDRRSSFF